MKDPHPRIRKALVVNRPRMMDSLQPFHSSSFVIVLVLYSAKSPGVARVKLTARAAGLV
jgi:hypothetical protein